MITEVLAMLDEALATGALQCPRSSTSHWSFDTFADTVDGVRPFQVSNVQP